MARIVGNFAAREGDGNGKPEAVDPRMDPGREAATRAAKTLILNPPFAPAACWRARTMVESIICTLLCAAPVAFNASRIVSHSPETDQRRNCWWTEFQLPK